MKFFRANIRWKHVDVFVVLWTRIVPLDSSVLWPLSVDQLIEQLRKLFRPWLCPVHCRFTVPLSSKRKPLADRARKKRRPVELVSRPIASCWSERRPIETPRKWPTNGREASLEAAFGRKLPSGDFRQSTIALLTPFYAVMEFWGGKINFFSFFPIKYFN